MCYTVKTKKPSPLLRSKLLIIWSSFVDNGTHERIVGVNKADKVIIRVSADEKTLCVFLTR